MRENMFLQLS